MVEASNDTGANNGLKVNPWWSLTTENIEKVHFSNLNSHECPLLSHKLNCPSCDLNYPVHFSITGGFSWRRCHMFAHQYHVTTMSFNRSVQVDWMDESRLNHRKRPTPDPLILPESNRFTIPHTKWSKLNKFILNFHEALPKVRVRWFGFNRYEWFLPQILTS